MFARLARGLRSRLTKLVLLALLALFIACSTESGEEDGHDDGAHEEQTTLFVVKAAERGERIPETLAERVLGFEHVVGVERYIRVRTESLDVVGVEPGAPLRIMTGQPDVHLMELPLPPGFQIDAWREGLPSALVGELYASEHGIEAGAQFQLPGTGLELTASVIFSTNPPALSRGVILPLTVVQRLYGSPEQVTHLWVAVDDEANLHDVIRTVQLDLGDSFQVLPRTTASFASP